MRRGRIVLISAIATVVVLGCGAAVVHAESRPSASVSASGSASASVSKHTGGPAVTPSPAVTVPELATTPLSSAADTSVESMPVVPRATTTSTSTAPFATRTSGSATTFSPTSRSAGKRPAKAGSSTAKTPPSASHADSTSSSTSTSTSDVAPTFVPVTPSAPLPKTNGSAEQVAGAVEDQVDAAADQGIDEHVEVMKRHTGAIVYTHDADDSVPAMSLVKAFVAADVLTRNGGINELDATTQANLWKMITASDDGIMQDFWDADGGNAIIERVINRYDLTETAPTSEDRYWGDVRITASDEAKFLREALADPLVGPWLGNAMVNSVDTGDDGYDQNFGVNHIPGTGSKQGWGCCLGGVMAIHSMGFSADEIIVVLSTAQPDASYHVLGTPEELLEDPGAEAAVDAVTRTAQAAVDPNG